MTERTYTRRGGTRGSRWALTALSASLICGGGASLQAAPPRGPQTHEERLTKLYDHDVSYKRGEPIVTVGVASGLQALTLYSPSGFTLYLDADPDNQLNVPSLKRWQVRLKSKRAELRSEQWEILDERPVTKVAELSDLEKLWGARGVQSIVRFQSGLYLPGNPSAERPPLEGRSIMLAHRPTPDLDLSAHLEGRSLPSLETLVSPARGLISAEGYEEGVKKRKKRKKKRKLSDPSASISARDVLWFESQGDRPVTLSYVTEEGEETSATYHGELYVALDRAGLSVVSVLSTEELIEGVVPSELYRSAPEEALKAQAVTARGQVVVKIGARHLADPYMLCASTHCQAYKGLNQHHKRTSAATRATRGMIAMTSDGQPLDSVYSSTCGGHTEAYHEVWGGAPKPHLLGVEDNASSSSQAVHSSSVEAFIKAPTAAFCQAPKRTFRWRVRRDASALLKSLQSLGHITQDELGELSSFEVLSRGVSGRAQAITYRGSKSSVVVYGDYANRQILGVKSGLWVSEPTSKGEWRISGGGFGHGVGMCQHGAMGMAKGGATMQEIISHYYAGAKVKTLW